jgi:hypothetical protein
MTGKISSSVLTVVGRLLKVAMVVVVVPLAIALLLSLLNQLNLLSASGDVAFRDWVLRGAWTYIGIHLLLYRPVRLFRISHWLFSTLAVWLFGGQVASVEQGRGKGGKGRESKGGRGEAAAQGSTLVAFSPYVIPLYTVLVCAVGWALGRSLDRALIDGPVSFCIGMTMAFHWLMTADQLQQQRGQWHLETYLLAIGLVFVLTLIVGGACLPWAVPEVSFVRALADALARAQAMYSAIVQQLFL